LTRPAVHVRLLGPVTILRDGVELPLPASRKVRALLTLLAAIAPDAVTRSRLCELLWDVPNDPRGELRWCLSKLRSVLDDRGSRRIETRADAVALNLSDCFVDVTEITRTTEAGVEKLDLQQLRALHRLFVGEFAEGLEIDRNPQFTSWLSAQRRRFLAVHVAVLEQLVGRRDDSANESLEYLEKWLQLTPFDERAHELLLSALLRCGRVQEAEEHFAATIRAFETEGLEWLALRQRWLALRNSRSDKLSPVHVTSGISPQNVIRSATVDAPAPRRASVCVMPFLERTPGNVSGGGVGDGLTDDIITQLARLRVLRVIARGTVYALGERSIPPDEAGRLLNVDYVASGSVRRHKDRITVAVELAEAKTARIVWTEEFVHKVNDAPAASGEIGNRIVASIAEEIETAERNRAMLKAPQSLDGWEAFHRGLWHMYQFNDNDTDRAAHFFEMAVRHDPTFARAYAGLSFTHFQNAFLHRTAERDRHIELAFATACKSMVADDRDPAAHWAMGRAFWLRGRQQESLDELEKSVELSPNFALGHYTLGFVQCQSGDPRMAIASTDFSRQLSPFDPLMFGMLASRAIAHVRLGQYQDAADWAVKGAIRPNAHEHILAIAASCLAMAGRPDEAHTFIHSIRKRTPRYGVDDLLSAFRFSAETSALFRQHAQQVNLC
jgi:DNA-binding SARP family transcriptional activator/TolB-like protein/Tfp pilus assembly protein PilF